MFEKQKKRKPVIHYPAAIEERAYTGKIYGHFFPDSNEYNILATEETNDLNYPCLGVIGSRSETDDQAEDSFLQGYRENEKLYFLQGKQKCKNQPYDLHANVFSRNTGILETQIMLEKAAVISGCGSVGGLVALELARAGVGRFLLIDNDTFAYHNICRHQCGIHDVGKFKVNAVKERILQINPEAKVTVAATVIERVPEKTFNDFCNENTIIIGCADNREGDLYADKLSKLYTIPFVSIGFWERAFAGEIFYAIPGRTVGYESIFSGEMSARISANRRVYTHEEDLQKVNFEPGISVDIGFVTLIAIKLIIDLLNKDNKDYLPRVLNDLTQFTLVCNTSDTRIAGNQAEIFSYPLQITRSIQVE